MIRRIVVICLVLIARSASAASIFFDDFNYSKSGEMKRRGWIIRTEAGHPGVPGAKWGEDRIEFLEDEGESILRMKSETAGTPSTTRQAQICHQRKYLEGTYAARLRFYDIAVGDRIVETFYMTSPLKAPMDPDYSATDFEYLPNGGRGQTGPALFATTWETLSPESNSKGDRLLTTERGSREGWHTLVIQVADNNVRYYIDGRILATHGGKFYPESFMSLNFNLWFIRDGLVKSKEPRTYRQDIDWVFHEAKKVVTPEEVEARVTALRRQGVRFRDSVPSPKPPLDSPCNL